jgi:hypothetical protein
VVYAEPFGWSFRDWGDDYADTIGSGFNADLDVCCEARLTREFAAA